MATLDRSDIEKLVEVMRSAKHCMKPEPGATFETDAGRRNCEDDVQIQIDKLEGVLRGSTPAAEWRIKGEPDPHGSHFDGERHDLAMGQYTDDTIANIVYLDPTLIHLTAAKERIRWLSRALIKATTRPPGTEKWSQDWMAEGFNYVLSTAEKALKFLASNPRPTGGEQEYNAEHLLQISRELRSDTEKMRKSRKW